MKYFEKVPATVLLEDGTVYRGFSAGKVGTTTGEICFNTGMTGYQEIFTDPSYNGQIMCMCNVHIGNYGTIQTENESDKVQISGLITRNFTNLFSRFTSDQEIQQYLLDQQIVAVTGVDSRALVSHIRDKGAMNVIISSETNDVNSLKEMLAKVPSMEGLELSSGVSCTEPYFFGEEDAAFRIAVLDLGIKRSILKNLASKGCYLKVFPAKSKFEEIEKWKADGYFASNGPGDPGSMDYAVDTVNKMIESGKPFFGICLGHQIFARTMGVETFKMHNGHRGINHPVKNLSTGKCEITTQNHGFSVNSEQCENHEILEVTHVNLNDQTVEGIKHRSQPAFSVQYHPEAAPGPNDSKYLFQQFFDLINAN